MADVITCPSGLQGRVRGMKVREERVLADRKLAKSGGQVDELLAACWEETLDPGPYALAEGAKLDLGKVLQGDRFFALLMVRALTYGPEYAFGVSCRNDNCRARIDWEIDADGAVVGRGSFGAPYEGPPGYDHGGWVACAFDEMLGIANIESGHPGMTARLTIHYRKPTPLFRPLRFKAWVDRLEGRRIMSRGELWDGDTLTAEADGIFVQPRPEVAEQYFGPRPD